MEQIRMKKINLAFQKWKYETSTQDVQRENVWLRERIEFLLSENLRM